MVKAKTKGTHGGKRKGAGRKVVKKQAILVTLPVGLMPIDYLVGISRGLQYVNGKWIDDPEITTSQKTDAAKAVCPYLHPRLSSVDSNLAVEGELKINVVRYTK